jgi:hypothetical protein
VIDIASLDLQEKEELLKRHWQKLIHVGFVSLKPTRNAVGKLPVMMLPYGKFPAICVLKQKNSATLKVRRWNLRIADDRVEKCPTHPLGVS